MKYNDFITKISAIVESNKFLLRLYGDMIHIDAECFNESVLNKIQRLLQLYGECSWCVMPSDTLTNGVMYWIKIYSFK